MGVEFQSVEGLVVVSETESEPECTPSAVDSLPFPPASKSLALPSYPADACEPTVEPFDPTTSRAFGQPLVCRHSKGYHEFVDGLGLCSPGRCGDRSREGGCAAGVNPTMLRVCSI